VLAQLGKTMEHPETAFSSETLAIVLDTLDGEKVPAIIDSCVVALSHVGGPADLPMILSFLTHSDPEVRHSVAFTLGSFSSNPEAIQGLIRLMQDKDRHVRDWATFGLGKSAQPDSPEVRDAFMKRVRDRHRDTREEAIGGLSNRKDLRVLPHLIRELQRKMVSRSVIESACELLDTPVPGWDDNWDAAGLIKSLKDRFPDDVPLAS
jgi:HEAT repeat protein